MGRLADVAGIQFRLLNRSKGAAVRGPRSQIDRQLYREAMQAELAATPNLTLMAEAVEDLIVDGRPGRRRRRRRRARPPRRARRADHRHLPQGRHPPGRAAHPRRPASARPRPSACPTDLYGLGPDDGAAQDRHAGASGRPHHRLGPAGDAGRPTPSRSRSRFLTDRDRPRPRSPAASPTPPRKPTGSSPSNLGESRRLWRPDRRAAARATAPRSRTRWCASPTRPATRSSWSPRAWTTTRSIPTASRPRCPPRPRTPFLRTIPGLEQVEVLPLRLRHRVRLRRSARADSRPWRSSACRACISPARSTAPRATRRRAPKGWSPA